MCAFSLFYVKLWYLCTDMNKILPAWVDVIVTVVSTQLSEMRLDRSDRLLTVCKMTYYLLTPWSRVLLEKLTSKLCS